MKKFGLFYLLLILPVILLAQNRTITGTVIDENNTPLPGANIVQKGTSNGVVADLNGNYKINLISGFPVLVFSYVGYDSEEVEIGDNSNMNVILSENAQNLDEVVVVGYGTQKKTDITGSVSSVNSQELEKAIFNNIDQVLQGRSAGVQVTSSSGEPGAPATIRIRGNNSISGSNAPLYVIDGIPISDTPNFNPQEIGNIEVLKDASATAIYGSRGANGVILITTKRGKLGKTIISFNQNTTFANMISTYDVLNGKDYADYRNETNVNLGLPEPFPNPSQYTGKGINWLQEISRTGIRSEYDLSLSGGQGNVKFYVSGNLLSDSGIIVGSSYKRGSFRANLDLNALEDRLKIKVNVNGTQTRNEKAINQTNGYPKSAGPIFDALTAEPLVPSIDYSGFIAEGLLFYNPYLEATDIDDRIFLTELIGNVEAKFKVTDNLSYTFNGGLNYRIRNRDVFKPNTVPSGELQNGLGQFDFSRAHDYITSNYLTYKNIFDKKHDLSGTLGYEYSEFNSFTNYASVTNFDIQILDYNNLGIGNGNKIVSSNRSQSVLQSGFFRLNYAFDNRYLVTATVRADGSSRFAANEKWGYFPSAAVGWRISEERFLQNSEIISNLKLRGSLGETGSQSIAPYQSLARYGTEVYGVGNSSNLAYIPTSVSNPNLRWETTKQLDIGVDLGLFNNRLEFVFDYFRKETYDLLQPIQIPTQSGFGTVLSNIGSIENRGIEFAINSSPFRSANFSWNTGLNVTTYKNKIIELGGDEEIFGPGLASNAFGSGHIYRPGDEYGLFYGLNATGLIQENDFDSEGNITIPILNSDSQLGHWKYEDLNGDGIISADDRKIIGNPNPDFIFGFNNDFSYKNFSLNIFFQGSIGNDIYNSMGTFLHSSWDISEPSKNQSVDWYQNRWTLQNPTNDIRYPSINGINPQIANYMVEDGSYIRLKNISLRYDLPLHTGAITGLQLYATATNLITVTDYTGLDPEISSLGADTLAPGVDLGTYPNQKSYTVGINLKF